MTEQSVSSQKLLTVKLINITKTKQEINSLTIPDGFSLKQALENAGLLGLVTSRGYSCGIWGKIKTLDTKLQDGDRIEIYHPLHIDPKLKRFEVLNIKN